MSRLYVGRLPRDVRERDIEKLFKGYGEIRDICLLSGFGFVEFRDRRDAEDVMHDFNNRDFMGERLLIEPARVDRRRERMDRGFRREDRGDDRGRRMGSMGAPQRTPFRMLVENLSSSVSWQDLKDFARRAGEVSFADAHKLRPGEGIVEFVDEEGLRTALRKLDGEELRGRRVVLREDFGPRGGNGGGGGGRYPRERSYSPRRSSRRSRSRSYSRERSRSPRYRRSSYNNRSSRSPPPPARRYSPGSPRSRSRSPVVRDGPNDLPPPPAAAPRSPSPLPPRDNANASPRSPDANGRADLPPAGAEPSADQNGSDGWE